MMDDIQHLAGKVSLVPSQDGIVRSYKPVRYDMGGFDERVHPEVQAMHREAQWFINDVVNKVRPRRWLSLLGASGIGKTHLAEAARDALFKERPSLPIQFWKWQKVVSMLRSGDWAFIEYLVKEVYVLILDDVGAENTSPAILSALNRVVDGRLGKWTMITSNLLLHAFTAAITWCAKSMTRRIIALKGTREGRKENETVRTEIDVHHVRSLFTTENVPGPDCHFVLHRT